MATRSSIFAWKIPWTKEPGRLQSMGLQRVGHDLAYTHTHTQAIFLFTLFYLGSFTSVLFRSILPGISPPLPLHYNG